MPFFFFDGTMILIVPALLLALWAQFKVKSTYAKYSKVDNRAGLTGADVAQLILRDNGIADSHSLYGGGGGQGVGIECIGGNLTDHYDPRTRTLRLSENVYYGRSVAALGIAAHEVGHAVQHAKMYSPLTLRNLIYPVCSIGSTLAFPLFFIGLFFRTGLSPLMMQAAIFMFSLSVFFTVLTLPVEFNASSRALKALSGSNYLQPDELKGAQKVLTAAAMTYVAAAAMAIMQLVRMLLIAGRR
ncbi:MAG: hypothetical protein GWP08_14715 [Nitrospiraceae bacterium]|nr:hypothetical protein [Nitrospiraceae bacterium]